MTEGLPVLWYSFPILLVTFMFAGGLLIRLTTRTAQPLRDYNYTPKVSILLPVYNEGAHVLETIGSIVSSNWPADKLEVIAIDDCSGDDSYEYVLKAQQQWPQIRASRNESNSGKHVTLTRALKQATGEIVICIDSDCIFDKNAIRELVSCFADPKVGAVGGNVGISNVNENVFTACQALIYFMMFQVGKMVQGARGHLFCISGCLFAVRRQLFEAVEEEVRERNWFGVKVRDGEDRYMTHSIMMRGWKTILNPHAHCWTAAPNKLQQLFAQQIRWRRSGLRDLFWTYRRLGEHLNVIGLRALLAALIPETFTCLWSFFLLSTVLVFGLGEALEFAVVAFLTFFSVFVVAALAYNAAVDRIARGSPKIRNPLVAGTAAVWFLTDSLLITLLALFTFDVGAWGTRENTATKQQKA